jgi:hypothetical protein
MVKLNQVLWVYFEDQYIINIRYAFILRKNIAYVLNFKNKLVVNRLINELITSNEGMWNEHAWMWNEGSIQTIGSYSFNKKLTF